MSALLNSSVIAAWLFTIAATVTAAVLDFRSFSVPNRLTFPFGVFGLVYHVAFGGYPGLVFCVTGMLVGFALLLLFFLIGAMGAGDIKLLVGVGAWLGPANTIWICLIACIASGVYSLGILVLLPRLRGNAGPHRSILMCIRSSGERLDVERSVEVAAHVEDRRWRVLPFAPMIAIGVLAVAIREYGLLFLQQV